MGEGGGSSWLDGTTVQGVSGHNYSPLRGTEVGTGVGGHQTDGRRPAGEADRMHPPTTPGTPCNASRRPIKPAVRAEFTLLTRRNGHKQPEEKIGTARTDASTGTEKLLDITSPGEMLSHSTLTHLQKASTWRGGRELELRAPCCECKGLQQLCKRVERSPQNQRWNYHVAQ